MGRKRIISLFILAAALVWLGRHIYRAHANLVTLRVHDMEVRRVISKLEWQTWERIVVNNQVGGHVTLDVKDVPLDEVLNIIGLQTDARWTRLYPIYSSGKAVVGLKKVVRGEIPIETSGWTNLQNNPFWQRNAMGGFGNTARAANNLVSAQFMDKPIDFAALALSRFAQAQVVPEDGASGTINLKLAQVPFEKAVAQVARQVHRKWDCLYALQSTRARMIVRKSDDRPEEIKNEGRARPDNVPKEAMTVKIDEPPKPSDQQMEAIMATMTPEERQKTMEQMAAAEQLRALPPAERQQKMQEMSAQFPSGPQGDMEQRIQNRLKDGTIDQRIAHDRAQLKRQGGKGQP
jgi:hypothetical protein